MDLTTLRLLLRLSVTVATLAVLVGAMLFSVQMPFGRTGRGLTVIGVLGSIVAVVLLTARLAQRRHPGSGLAVMAPEILFRTAVATVKDSGTLAAAAVHRRRRRARARRVQLAATEAAADDARLAPETIIKSAEALFRLVHLARHARDPARLATLLDPALGLEEWERRLDPDRGARQPSHTEVRGGVRVDLVGLGRCAVDGVKVTVIIEAHLASRSDDDRRPADRPEKSPNIVRLCQYWTLAMRDGLWTVRTIQERAAGEHHLAEPIMTATRLTA